MLNKNIGLSKKYCVISAFLLLIVILLYGYKGEKIDMPKASQGVIDLSSWNFEKDGSVKLEGQWEIYQGQLLEPEDFKDKDKVEAKDFFNIPSSFVTTVNNNKLPKFGYATMRITIKMNANNNIGYGIRTGYILSASKIWINGELITSVGEVSKETSGAVGSFEHQLAFFKPHNSEAEIIIQTSNFNNVTGKVQDIFLGNNMDIKRDYFASIAADMFTIGCLFIIGIYHFALYYKRQQYKEPLYFGLFCLIIALRNFLVSQRAVFEFYPDIPFGMFNKMAYLTVYFAAPFLIMFFKELFKKEFSSKVVTVTKAASICISLLTIFTNIEFYNKFLIYYEIFCVVLLIYSLFIIIKAVINKNQGASIILFGFVVFVAAVLHDMFLQAGILFSTSLAPFGFLIFIFSQAYMLAARFSNAFTEIEKLVEENKAVYTDELTGILNRRGFYEQGSNLFKAASITGGKFILFYGDLNKFKSINDSFGHKEGDAAIKETAYLLKYSFGKDDIVARMSGDEFTGIAVNKSTEEEAEKIIELIKRNFDNYNASSNKPYKLSISIGYSIYQPAVNATFEELINEADARLYDDKIINKAKDLVYRRS